MSKIKQIMSIAFLATASLYSPGNDAQAQPTPKAIKNVVLVHGAFADGSSWTKVIAQLQAKGFHVAAVQNPLTSLADDVAATKRAIDLMDGPVLLVGHSYGGMVISEAGNDPKVAGLLYVCALIPNDDQAVVDVVKAFAPAPGSGEFQPDEAGFLSLSHKGIHAYFAQDLPQQERDVIYATQTPWAVRATTDKISKAAWKVKPSWCIIGLDDQMVSPELARAEAKMIGAKTLEIKSSHVPMVSRPEEVTRFITQAIQAL